MERRKFIQLTGAASLSSILACKQETKAVLKKTPYLNSLGIQLWTVRNLLGDAQGTLKAIKQAGYQQIELMRLAQLDELGEIARGEGLEIKCSHLTNQIISGNWERMGQAKPDMSSEDLIAKASKNGLEHITFAYWGAGERQSIDDYKMLAAKLNSFGELCNSAGLKFSYHNHSFEFLPMDGTIGYDILLDEVDADKMGMELDVFWCNIGGVEPVELMDKMKGRTSLLHLKDQAKGSAIEFDESKVAAETFQEVGDGSLDFKAIMDRAVKYGVDYCHVEQDQSPDVLASIVQSQNYLANMNS